MNFERPDIAGLVARWEATPHSITHVRDGANAVYAIQAGSSRRFLRLTRDRHRSRCQLEAEPGFYPVRRIATRGSSVSAAVSQRCVVETVRAGDADAWHAVMFEAAVGRHFRFFSSDIDRPLFHAWGSAMGALHIASRDFVPVASRLRPSWAEQDTTRCDYGDLPTTEEAVRREHARVMDWLGSLHTTPESWGLIHGDFERTNFVLDERTLRLYDFDDACYHWYVADVAHALWAFRGAPPSDRRRFLTWFLEGYRERCPVDADVREQLSWFVRLRSLTRFMHQLHARAASGGSAADSTWDRRMRAAFEEPFWW